jgi:hypothetical protein
MNGRKRKPISCASGASAATGRRMKDPVLANLAALCRVFQAPGDGGRVHLGEPVVIPVIAQPLFPNLGKERGGRNRFPSGHPLQNALGILDGVHMPVVIFDHLNRRSHLLRKNINIHAFA